MTQRTVLFALLLSIAIPCAHGDAPATNKTQAVQAGLPATKKLLVLMDTDRNGKVSKQEFMNFMEQEFDQLDVNKDGVLDVSELEKLIPALKHTGGPSR